MDSLRTGLRRTIDELPRAYWTIWFGTLVNRLGGFVVPFLALYLTQSRGIGIAEAGRIVSLFGLGSLCAGPLGGVLADRVGRRATMLIGLFGGGAVMIALGLAERPGMIALDVLLLGLVYELYRPAVSAMVADIVPPEKRLLAYATLYWAVNLGFSLAPVIAGLLARTNYVWLFVGDAATTWIYGFIVWRNVDETRPTAPPRNDAKVSGGLALVLSDGVFMVFVALSFFAGLVFLQHGTTLPIDMASHGIPARTYGLVIAVNGVLVILVQPFAARVLGRLRRSRVLAGASFVMGLGFGMYALPGSAIWYACGVAVWTMGEVAMSPTTSSIVADLAPTDLRGRYQGVFMMSSGLAGFVAPTVGALILAERGSKTLWAGCFAIGAVVALGHLAIAGARLRRLARARALA